MLVGLGVYIANSVSTLHPTPDAFAVVVSCSSIICSLTQMYF